MMQKLVFLSLTAALVVCGQDTRSPAQTPPTAARPLAERPPAAADLTVAVDSKTFVIGADDVLRIRVWREPELGADLRVRPDGKITLPLGGEVQAAGRTPEQLGQEVAKALASYINGPLVMVSVLEVRSKKYSVTGEVNRPAAYPLVVPTTILDAIINAGGFRDYAKKKKVTVLRKGKVIKFNYEEVIKGKNLQQNIGVEDGDLIVVP